MKNKNPTKPNPLAGIPDEMQVAMQLVLNGLGSRSSVRHYRRALRDFLGYWHGLGEPVPDKLFLQTYVQDMLAHGVGKYSINTRLGAIRNFTNEAVDLGIWPEKVAADFARVRRMPVRGAHHATWLTLEQAQALVDAPDTTTLKGLRDRAILAVMLGCGLRRAEVAGIDVAHIQQRESVWVLADIVGKRSRVRTVVMPGWVKQILDDYLGAVGLEDGRLFRAMSRDGSFIRPGIAGGSLYAIVRKYGAMCDLPEISPHDLRRTYAKLAYQNGAKLDQLQVNLGHSSLTTTQVYLGLALDVEDGPGSYLEIEI